MDEHLIDLINRKIDREASREEVAELERILAANPEARELHDGIRDLVAKIEAVEPVEPPGDLRADILASVRPASPEKSRVVEGRFGAASVIRTAWAVAAGIVLGFILYPLVLGIPHQSPVDIRNASGTIGTIPRPSPSEQIISTPGGEAKLSLASRGSEILVGIDLERDTEEPIRLSFDAGAFGFNGLDREMGNPNVTIGPGRIEIGGPAGSRVELHLSRPDGQTGPIALSPEHGEAGAGQARITLVESQ